MVVAITSLFARTLQAHEPVERVLQATPAVAPPIVPISMSVYLQTEAAMPSQPAATLQDPALALTALQAILEMVPLDVLN